MLKFYDVEQNTEEWLKLRSGHVGGSKIGLIMANYGKAFGEPARKLAVNIAVEQLTGECIKSTFSNEHTQRGHEQEPIARELYEQLNFTEVENGGFFDCGLYGFSPDGLVGDDGLIEIKSVVPSVHFANIKRGGIDPAYKWQCHANLLFSGRGWLDFVSYCSDFPSDKKIFEHRLHIDEVDKEKIETRLNEFENLIIETKATIEGKL